MSRTIYINHGDNDFALMDVSALVATLSTMPAFIPNTFTAREAKAARDVGFQAQALASPVLDYEAAARETIANFPGRFIDADDAAGDYAAFCDLHDIEPHKREVLEHWAVDAKLGFLLQSRGERVDMDFSGFVVWARNSDTPIEECPVLAGLAG